MFTPTSRAYWGYLLPPGTASSGFKISSLPQGLKEAVPVGVMPSQPAVTVNYGVYCPGLGSPLIHMVQVRDHGLFMGQRDIDPQQAWPPQTLYEIADPIWSHLPGLIRGVNSQVVQCRLLEDGRNGVPNGVADNAQFQAQGPLPLHQDFVYLPATGHGIVVIVIY